MQLIRILLCKGLLLLLRSCREDVRTERIIGTATSYMVVRMALTRAGKQNEEWEYLNHRKWSRRSTLSRRWWWARWESSAKTWPQSNSAAVCECTSYNLNSPWSTESVPLCSPCLYVMLAIIFWSVPNNSRWLRSVFDFQLVTSNGKLVLLAEPVENVQAALIHEHDGVLRRHTVKCYKRIYGLCRLLSICPLNRLLTFMFKAKCWSYYCEEKITQPTNCSCFLRSSRFFCFIFCSIKVRIFDISLSTSATSLLNSFVHW